MEDKGMPSFSNFQGRTFRSDNNPQGRNPSIGNTPKEGENVIIGDKAIIVTYFAYYPDEKRRPVLRNVLMGEIDEWIKRDPNVGGLILNDLEDVAKNGLFETGRLRSECLTRPIFFKGKRIFEWKHDNNGGLRYYVSSIKQRDGANYEKPIYFVLAVGDKTSQKGDFGKKPSDSKILKRYDVLASGKIDVYGAIGKAMQFSEKKIMPVPIASHNSKANLTSKRNKDKGQKKRC